jgi:glycerophosphoryl diester phosphodiesterase
MTDMGEGRPQVVAHRGSSATHAEHTLGAYLAALDEGADGLECDVRLTRDGHLVCLHDRDLRRTALRQGIVSTMTLAELERLDFSSWKHPGGPPVDPALGGVLTLRRLLEIVAAQPRRVELAIETKHPTRYGARVERSLVALLAEFGWTGPDAPVRVMSFSWLALRRVRRLAPGLRLVFLLDRPGRWARSRPVAAPDWIAGPGVALLREHPDRIRRIRAAGTVVHVWTVNTAADIDLCRDHGVAAVITDRPRETIEYLDGRSGDEV